MTEPFKHQSSRRLTCFDETKDLVAGMSSRQGGHSRQPFGTFNLGMHVPDKEGTVLSNRKLLANEIGFPLERWVMGEQIHSTNVQAIMTEDIGKGAYKHSTAIPAVDGLITNQPNVLLTAFYADCVPLLFCDPVSGWIGIAHAGWKGTVHSMAAEMIGKLENQGASIQNMHMVIGPSIGINHYEVDHRVIEYVPDDLKDKVITPVSNKKYKLDLRALNRLIALEAGLQNQNISVTSYCTYEEKKLFFSHRRDQGRTGRMLGFIGWKG